MKDILKKDLSNDEFLYEEIQNVLVETKMIINNRPVTNLYLESKIYNQNAIKTKSNGFLSPSYVRSF